MKKTCNHSLVTLDCTDVGDCINTELAKVISDTPSTLANFCEAVSTCVDAEFASVAAGESNNLDHFGLAFNKVIESFSGYSTSGDFYFTSTNGDIQWTQTTAGTTVVVQGTGITVTGAGTSGNPYVVSSSITQYTDEQAQDAVGTILSSEFTYTDATPSIAINAIPLSKITTAFTSLLYGNGTSVASASVSSPLQMLAGTLSLLTVGPTFGGTGLATYAQGDILYASASNVLSALAKSVTATRYLANTGASNSPAWDQVNLANGVIGVLPTANGGTGLSTIGTSLQLLRVNAGGTALEYFTSPFSSGNDPITLSGDASGTGTTAITVSLTANAVTDSVLRDSTGYSVIGKSTTGTGDPADIVAGVDSVLRRSGSGDLQFGTIVTNNIGDAQVTLGKIQSINTQRVLGRSSAGSGAPESLSLGNNLKITGGVLDTYGKTLIAVNVYITSSTWSKPTGTNAALVITVAGGGGGAGANANSAEAAFGDGGGAGGHVVDWITSGLNATETVTIGAGGAGGNSGNSFNGASGSASTFGAHTAAAGGAGVNTQGSGTAAAIGAYGGLGGSYTTNITTIGGGQGGRGTFGLRLSGTVAQGGWGGYSIFGNDSTSSTSYGAGGNGNFALNGTSANGGAGASGIVIVYSYS